MFSGCTSLVDASDITITRCGWDSLRSMFQNCTSLTTSPIIQSDISQSGARGMFWGCSSLTTVTYLGSEMPRSGYSDNWMLFVPNSGTFNMSSNYGWDFNVSRDSDGVPSGWSINKT